MGRNTGPFSSVLPVEDGTAPTAGVPQASVEVNSLSTLPTPGHSSWRPSVADRKDLIPETIHTMFVCHDVDADGHIDIL